MPAPRVLAILPSFIPSTMITIVKPLVQLHQSGEVVARISLEPLATVDDVRASDAVVFCRNVEPHYGHLLETALGAGIPVIYDLDDNLFEFPEESAAGQRYLTPARHAMLTRYLESASLVRVYSEPLQAIVAPYARRVEQITAPVDLDLIVPPAEPLPGAKIRIVYATSRWQDDLYRLFFPALSAVVEGFGDRVEAHFWGPNPQALRTLPGVKCHPPVYQYDRFLRQFSQGGFDIGLAPLLDSPFYRCKTNNKFREYGAAGIAGIYSRVDAYTSCVCHRQTGMLVDNDPAQWQQAMVSLIEQPELRQSIQRDARRYVVEHYSQAEFATRFCNHIYEVVNQGGGAAPPIPPGLATGPPAQQSGNRTDRPGCSQRPASAGLHPAPRAAADLERLALALQQLVDPGQTPLSVADLGTPFAWTRLPRMTSRHH